VADYKSDGGQTAMALAIDSTGKPRIAYNSDRRVVYAWPENLDPSSTVWSSVRLRPFATDPFPVSVGGLALDAANRPRLSFVEGPGGSGRFFTVGYFEWSGVLEEMPSYEKASTQGYPSAATRLALAEGSGAPAIAYIAEGSVRFAHKPAGTWVVEDTRVVTALPIGYGGQHPFFSLALSRSGESAVATVNGTQLSVSIRKDGVWTPEKVVSRTDGKKTYLPVLGYDDGGVLHLIYVLTGTGLRHARRINGAWEDTSIFDVNVEGEGGALHAAIARDGRIHVMYGPIYFRYDGCRWDMDFVRLDTGVAGTATVMALALDGSGNPHLAYTIAFAMSTEYRYAYPSGP
jgi:hypothetical protein